MTAKLIDLGGRHLDVPFKGEVLLGRSNACELQFVSDLGCSREQVLVRGVSGTFEIVPLSANSPTFLNGELLDGVRALHNGDEISFSLQTVQFRAEDSGYVSMPETVKRKITIGRVSSHADLVLGHPQVSRLHAEFLSGTPATIVDLGSTNGTFVNGVRVAGEASLGAGDRVSIGPYTLLFDGISLAIAPTSQEFGLLGKELSVDVAGTDGEIIRILNDASVEIGASEFVCIVGPSGSGKSTLMSVLSGRLSPTSGDVQLGQTQLFQNFERLKPDIAFVPQHDVLHENLTLRSALTYTARLRLPSDTSSEAISRLVELSAEDVGLESRLDTRIKNLSGGQKKRASLASETLSQPGILFLDEVTSGLDEATDREIMRLLGLKAGAGMTIVCVTHTMANVEDFCERLIVMAEGGFVTYDGPPTQAADHFGVERIGQLFDCLKDYPVVSNAPEDQPGNSPVTAQPAAVNKFSSIDLSIALRQFAILAQRNVELIASDRRGLIMATTQMVLIGGLIGYAFNDFGSNFEIVASQNALLLLLGLCSVWLGCNSAAQSIVTELPIFRREHDVNLSAISFVTAKFAVSAAFTAVQFAVVFGLVALFAEDIPGPEVPQLLLLLLGSITGTAMGLLLSSLADTAEQATMIVPLTLVPQLIFAGVLVPRLPEFAVSFAKVAVSGYWLTEGMKDNLISTEGPVQMFDAASARVTTMSAEDVGLGATIIAAHIAAFLILTVFATKRRAQR